MNILRITSENPDFQKLVKQLDAYLAVMDGDEHAFYNQYNKIDMLKNCVVIFDNDEAVACGAVCRLAAMPGKSWSNPQMAQALHPQFVDGYRAAYHWRLENTAVNSFQNPVQRQEFF